MSRKFLVIANPKSGAFDFGGLIDVTINFLNQNNINYDLIYTTRGKNCGLSFSTHFLNNFTDVLVIGGDGTINATVNATIENPLPISIVPAGTGNDFIKNLSVPKKIEGALMNALNGEVLWSDCGKCNDKFFINGIGIGFDGKVVEHMMDNRSTWKGHLAYLSTVVKILASFKERELKYSYDHTTISKDVFLMTIANGTTFGGGFKLNPDANLEDGLLNVCVINTIHPLKRFLKIHLLKDGKHGKLKEVDFFTVKDIKIERSDLLVAHMDGEYLGKPPFHITVVPKTVPFRFTKD